MRRIEEFWIEFEPEIPQTNRVVSFGFDVVDSIKGAAIVAFVVFCFAFRVIGVDGDSMLPTLHNGDWVLVSGTSYDIDRGDIVIVTQPWERNVPIVKRVIAVGGDEVDIDFYEGVVYVNGEKLQEDYLDELTRTGFDVTFPQKVPDGTVFIMGDNRDNSLDSRSSKIGFVDERYILGEVILRIYPFGEWNVYN